MKRTDQYDPAALKHIEKEFDQWELNEVSSFIKRAPESKTEYTTASGMPTKRTYTPLDLKNTPFEDIGFPGQYPFTRGPYPTMYRGRNWTMRQIAGFGTARETNGRFKYLIAQGQTGLSIDFDMPTLMGYDSSHAMSQGEVGREGVAIDTLADMEELFDDIDLTKISVSMTINPSAWILYAMYIALAQKRGYDLNDLSGTIQNDILKEYIAQKEWIFPVRPSVRLVRDCIQYGSENMKRYNPINISGYHISEAGSTAVQEVAYTMATTMEYVRTAIDAGVDVNEFGPRLSFFFVSQADFFEEIAKFRAARRVYAKIMREKFNATKPEASRLRFHAQTAAATLTKPQYTINPIRTALQALSAVLGGAQSLHTNGMDEAFAIPTEEAMRIALRTQQIIAYETNITQVVDPLGGSYYVENLTDEIEKEVWKILDEVEELGGTLQCIDDGYFQRGISDSAYDFALRKASGERPVIGVNMFVQDEEDVEIETHPHDPETERRQIERLNKVKDNRDEEKVQSMLKQLKEQAEDESANLMPITIELVKEGASMGDIVETLKGIWGTYREKPVI
ncbi:MULTISPECIES: methylmalonyl-CoA mutase family protein [unclassified Marinobacter]|jgi:methylmalonyl-CoA mutase N-terminal domain/subunit|uniref:methylmalonyl-CoA mutase family protein n=1 Tax=unclassified Marinobacter TaxID=83889 RepID=UPI000C8E6EDE|nr:MULTISPECIES: methylmalonyl-CoA mutase family protein [unclassified Marinobacter]MAB51852.1 methylmalonyl-CoA mutase [Marinobacter sp.]|tara:strand:+ start:14821 stop:16518 length:1698 start_codon:yes stop_codon:yes gene_type:complete